MTKHAKRILIFGGTFDPPHRAHVELPGIVARLLGCDRLIYVPTSANPLKDEQPAPAQHRLAMLRIAIRDLPGAEIDTIELDGAEVGEPSYTIDTLAAFRERFGSVVDLRFLIGADSVLSFDRWREPERILELATPVVVLRPPWTRESFENRLREVFDDDRVESWMRDTVETPLMDISATEIRERLQRGEDATDLIDARVQDYIRREGLYGCASE